MNDLLHFSPELGEQLTLLDSLVEDESVILEGSLAEWGFTLGDLRIEVFDETPTSLTTKELTIYPLDGRNQPSYVEVRHFDYKLETIKATLQMVLAARARFGILTEEAEDFFEGRLAS